MEISKQYDPKSVEDRLYQFWLDADLMHAELDSNSEPYTIVIPPPNVTDRLHMGHAFNNTIQDILIRYHKMKGFNALWIPGTDHAGIATQNVVERQLRENDGLSRHDLGREAFVAKVWAWRELHGGIIINQLKRLGCACDWSRIKFTMDDDLSRAVTETFVRLYEKGLVYRGKYIVNWCPRCQTALSDEEVNHLEKESSLWYVKYAVVGTEAEITVATTRPETILGDTAVAVHPDDKRYKKLVGKQALLPVIDRKIPIIADDQVDPKFGTGAVKVTPAHDPNDFEIGQRHGLEAIVVIDTEGRMNDQAGSFSGKDRFQARKQLITMLEKQNRVEKIESHVHSVGHCQRCNTVVEPYLSEQWFVKIKPLSEPALKAVQSGDITLMPGRWIKVYENWMTNVRDWCISRQLWWGHRIPVYYCQDCDEMMVLREAPTACEKCNGSALVQDPDVLDTWFSSWLWPFSTMGWPEETADQDYFYPTSTLVTGPDIIFFWVARMIMSGLEFKGQIPFSSVYFNGIVRDANGRKMSKSLGNGIDPVAMIERYSADAVRFSLISLSSEGQDINLSEDSFEIGRNFANKFWNAFRFLTQNTESRMSTEEFAAFYRDRGNDLTLPDRWILSRYVATCQRAGEALEKFRFSQYLDSLHAFFWGDFCDWYLELIKPRLYGEDEADKEVPMAVALYLMKRTAQLLHPVIPFITEEIWQLLRTEGESQSVMASPWPDADAAWRSAEAEKDMDFLMEIVGVIRNIRSEMNVPPGKKAEIHLKTAGGHQSSLTRDNQAHLSGLANVERWHIGEEMMRPDLSATALVQGAELYLPLGGLIDIEVEKQRLNKEIDRLEGQLTKLAVKLNNQNFVSRAPREVIEKERSKKTTFEETLQKLKDNIEILDA